MQPRGFAVRGLLQPFIFWPRRVCRPPACHLTPGGGGGGVCGTHRPLPLVGWPALLDLHTSFPYNALENHLQVFTHPFPLHWCQSVAVRHNSPQVSNK